MYSNSSPHSSHHSNDSISEEQHQDSRHGKPKFKALDLSIKAKSPNNSKNTQQHSSKTGQDLISQENQYNKSLLLSIQNLANNNCKNQQPPFPYNQNLVTPVTQFMKNNNQNLEANQLLASYLNQLKFPFQNFNVPVTQTTCTADLLKKEAKQSPEKPNSKLNHQSQNKDVLDLSLPNRSRQLKERTSESLLSNFKSSISSSTISSLSPLSSISNVSESVNTDNKYQTDTNYEDEDINRSVDSCDQANTNRKPINLNKKKRSDTSEGPVSKKSKLETNSQSQEKLLAKASNLLSSLSSQQNLLSLINNMAGNNNNQVSNNNNTASQDNFFVDLKSMNQHHQLMNQLSSNANLLSSLNMMQVINPFLNQQNKSSMMQQDMNMLAGFEQSQQNRSSLDQFLQYSNYMKMIETYQKNMIDNRNNTNGSASNNNIFNQACFNMNNNFSNIPLGLIKKQEK